MNAKFLFPAFFLLFAQTLFGQNLAEAKRLAEIGQHTIVNIVVIGLLMLLEI